MCSSLTNFLATCYVWQGIQSRWNISPSALSRNRRDFRKVIIYFSPLSVSIDCYQFSCIIIFDAAPRPLNIHVWRLASSLIILWLYFVSFGKYASVLLNVYYPIADLLLIFSITILVYFDLFCLIYNSLPVFFTSNLWIFIA